MKASPTPELSERELSAAYLFPREQLIRFRALTPHQRLHWLDEARRFTLRCQKGARTKHEE